MHRAVRILLVLGLVVVAPAPVITQTEPVAVAAWVAVPAAGATFASAYVEVKNPSMYDIYIVSATSDAAARVELRAPATGGAEPAVVPEFAVPAFGSIDAAATAPHVRLVGLSRPLTAGGTVALTLTTDTGVTLTVAAAVRTP